ncbi:hypothetical protein F0U60_48110 [Archangium minus]|uniref:Lipoprotein n=1 Tax=Archangium minus TaxID=83450 RepID=A0ABY9X6L9_9BACT|nr:hypothetical protein F0U60_48110 [Archangium minus]
MRRSALLLGLGALLCATACVSLVGGDGGEGGGGGISPSQFMFEPYVPADLLEPGGWKVARVIITLVRKSDEGVRFVPCQVQVEVPESNYRGVVSNEFAQQEAAKAADTAVERVLPQGLMSAEMCKRFRDEMQRLLQGAVPGTRVNEFLERRGSRQKRP